MFASQFFKWRPILKGNAGMWPFNNFLENTTPLGKLKPASSIALTGKDKFFRREALARETGEIGRAEMLKKSIFRKCSDYFIPTSRREILIYIVPRLASVRAGECIPALTPYNDRVWTNSFSQESGRKLKTGRDVGVSF